MVGTAAAMKVDMAGHVAMFKLVGATVGLSLGLGVTFGSLLAALTLVLR